MTGSMGIALAAGLLSSVLFLSLAKGLAAGILLSYLAPLPLMMAGLSQGNRGIVAAGLAAMAAVAGVSGVWSLLPYAVTVLLPSLVVSRQALLWRSDAQGRVEWYPPGLLLAWLTGMGMALLVVGWMAAPVRVEGGDAVGIEAWVRDVLGQVLATMLPDLGPDQRKAALDWWVPLFPAMVAGSWVVMAVLNAAAAQALLARLGRSRRPMPAYGELELPVWMGVATVLSWGVGSVAGGDLGYVARGLAWVSLLPFAILGLTAIHGWAARRPGARGLLALMYGVLFLASAWVLLPLTGLGVARFLTRLRRTVREDGGKED